MDKRPIGVFDSGLGGLTVVKKIHEQLPNEDIVYLGDTARVPYGTRSPQTITKFALEDVTFLLTRDVKCIVIACNTVSSVASDVIRKKTSLPNFDVITEGVYEAIKVTKNRNIGIIGTRATIASGRYKEELLSYNNDFKVVSVACPLLVPLIEEGKSDSGAMKVITDEYFNEFSGSCIDTLVLGCTHYPLIQKYAKEYFGNEVAIVNPADQLSLALKNYLKRNNLIGNSGGDIHVFATDITPTFEEVAAKFWGESIKHFEKIDIGKQD